MLSELFWLCFLCSTLFRQCDIKFVLTFLFFSWSRENSVACVLFDKCELDTSAAYQETRDTIIVAVLNLCRVSRNLNGT